VGVANPVKLRTRVSRIIPHGQGVYEVGLTPEGRVPRFKSGQFLHLALDDYDPAGGFWPESRVFSIASSYAAEEIVVVYSVKGAYTHRMEAELAPGKNVWLKLPYGDFHVDTQVRRPIVLVAGGTGVSPYVPFIEELAVAGPDGPPVRLYYGARKADQLLFIDQIAGCARGQGRFSFVLYVEAGAEDACARLGVLNIGSIREETRGLGQALYYLSGPPDMIRTFRERLVQDGMAPCDIKTDEWE
jgi:NAD(P)H-flavin reductase